MILTLKFKDGYDVKLEAAEKGLSRSLVGFGEGY